MTVLYIYKEEDIHQCNELSCLREGYHYVGRESPIVCKDKRISRKHAIVIVHRNGAIIKAAHVNPTFFKSSIGGPIQILKENDTLALNNGDQFALVEDSIWFTVKIMFEHVQFEIVNDVSYNTISNKRVHEDNIFENQKRIKIEDENVSYQNNGLNNSSNNALTQLDDILPVKNIYRPDGAADNICYDNDALNNSNSVLTNGHIHLETSNLSGLPNSVSRSRLDEILPIGNTNGPADHPVNPDTFSSASAVNILNKSSSTGVNISSGTVDLNTTISINHPSTSNALNIQIDNLLNTTCIKQEPLENINCNYTASTVSNYNNSTIQVKTEIKEEPAEEHSTEIKKDLPIKMTDDEPRSNDHNKPSGSTNNSAQNPNDRRDKCWYGKHCYRKNAAHKTNFSHPGDNDYDSDPSDIRPVCPFGIHCYRRNVPHRRQFRHFGPPAPKPPNVNVHVNVVNYPPNPNQKPDYESDCESDPDD